MKTIILGLNLLKRNFKTLFLFEICYKILALLVFTPFCIFVFDLTMTLSGQYYLSNDNVFDYLTSPSSIFVLTFLLLLLAIFIIIEISAIIQCYHASYYKQKITVSQMFRIGLVTAIKLAYPKNIALILFVLFVIPLTHCIQLSGYLSAIRIPQFIIKYIRANQLLFLAFAVFMLLLSILVIRWIYAFHYFTIDRCRFKLARHKSSNLMKGHYIINILGYIAWNVLLLALTGLLLIAAVFFTYIVVKVFAAKKLIYVIMLGVSTVALKIMLAVFVLFTTPIAFAYISALYYGEKIILKETIAPFKPPYPLRTKAIEIKKWAISITIILAIFNLSSFLISKNTHYPQAELFNKPTITAHRGDSVTAPENTIPAFESAIDNLADYAELDVQQTKDGIIVVMHDSNLKRISGKNINIWDVTYDEIKDIDVGSWFNPKFSNVRLATLDEVIQLAKGRLKLNIELKPNGHEKNFEESVVSIIKEHNFEQECVITSMKYSTIERIKEIEPDIKTVYVLSVAYGSIAKLKAADAFSIEASFVTKRLLNSIKHNGKDIYVWTVNSKSLMEKMMNLGVDSIITDDPVKAREVLYTETTSDWVVKLMKNIIAPR